MTTSPTVSVVNRAAARKLTSNLAGCGALSDTSTTTSRIGQKAEATASGMSSATRRAYSPGIALLRVGQLVRIASRAPRTPATRRIRLPNRLDVRNRADESADLDLFVGLDGRLGGATALLAQTNVTWVPGSACSASTTASVSILPSLAL